MKNQSKPKPTIMKKLLYILVMFAGIANAQIVSIPDPNFKAKLLDTSTYPVATDIFGNQMVIDTNGDGEIQQSEAQLIPNLNLSSANITSLEGLQYFTNLQSLRCDDNSLTSIDVTSLTQLAGLSCRNNQLTSLNVVGLANMTFLEVPFNQLTSIDLTGLVALQWLVCKDNHLSSLNPIAFTSLAHIDCANNQITSLNVSAFPNLTRLYCSNNQLTTLDLNGLTHLVELNCNTNQLTALDVTQSVDITDINCSGNLITTLNINGLSHLINLYCDNNQLTTLNTTGLINLNFLGCSSNNLTTLDVTDLTSLISLYCMSNQLNTINLNGLSSLYNLYCQNNQFTSLNLSGLGLASLHSLHCYNNNLTNLNVDGLTSLDQIYCWDNNLASLSVTDLPNLTALFCYNNVLTNLTLSNLPLLGGIACSNNQLTTLDVSGFPLLQVVTCQQNNLTSLNLGSLANFSQVNCNTNQLTTIDFSGLPNLLIANVTNNLFQSLDFSNNGLLQVFYASDNPNLESVFIKNGISEIQESFTFTNCNNLAFICADENQVTNVQNILLTNGYPNIACNTYCTFTPGGNYNTISGRLTFDADNNGCDASDDIQPNIKININDSTVTGATFTNTSGDYTFYTQAGSFDIVPAVENPTWFNFSPASVTIPFADNNNNTVNQNFCITANGIHPDVEVVVAPITPARPGFDAVYKITYRNKGNQTVVGVNTFTYDDEKTDFVSASQNPDLQDIGTLYWDFGNLLPFESRTITVTLHIHAPTDSVPVNIGDQLIFNHDITTNPLDENPSDNTFQYNQIVIGSFDPNEIVCLEGNIVSPIEIGKYLHYIINFENTGTADAENIVVREVIDTTQFDVNSLQLLDSSAFVTSRLTGNVAEFIFPNINLHSGGHGNILIKVKSKNTLVEGDSVSKRANIYFDYNAPIDTNLENTIFQALSNPDTPLDESILVYPNPTKGNVNINCNTNIKSVQLFDVQGRLLQAEMVNENQTAIDMSAQSNGVYFLKIISDKGIGVKKIVRE